jgi:DUF4097 and DUF4098 domain-containing protein YvlB
MKKLLACTLLAVPACVIHIGSHGDWDFEGPTSHSHSTSSVNGQMVETGDGEVSVDGTRLPYSRWVEATLEADPAAALHVQTASGSIQLTGGDGPSHVSALVWSEFEGDGKVVIEKGELVARGERGKTLIDEVRGQLPRGAALRADSGTGDVELHGFAGAPELGLGSGTGHLLAHDCATTSLHAKSGTGDVRVEGGSGERLDAESGTGDINCRGAHFGQANLHSGTGDLEVTDCSFDRLQVDSGTGDATIRGGKIGELHHDMGTGELDWKQATR